MIEQKAAYKWEGSAEKIASCSKKIINEETRVVEVKSARRKCWGKRNGKVSLAVSKRGSTNNTTCKGYKNRGKIRRGKETDEYKETNIDN